MRLLVFTFCLVCLAIACYPNLFTPIVDYLVNKSIINTQVNKILTHTSHIYTSLPRIDGWRIAIIASILSIFLNNAYTFLFHKRLTLKQRAIEGFFNFVGRVPIIREKIREEIKKADQLIKESAVIKNAPSSRTVVPVKGLSKAEVLMECEKHARIGEWDWNKGKVSGTVYVFDKDHKQLMEQVYSLFYETNPLHPDVFPGVRKMESEVVSMCLHLFHGESGYGATTSGGTASILMAMKAYREVGYARGIEFPEIVMSNSTHPAFMKAATYFGMRPRRFKVGSDFRANPAAYKRAINSNTVVLVVSAPCYPHGIIDPVEEVSKLGVKYNIGVHVDCCLGSLMVPFMKEAGYPIPLVDFRLEGVSSISCDTHKYGNGPKGCSVVMYRTKELRANQYFEDPNFTGGIYCSPGLPGSRNGSILASTWATMVHTGRDGYIEKTKGIVEVRQSIEREVRKIPGLKVFGDPKMSIVSFGSDELSIYAISDNMAHKGWRMTNNQFPAGVHMAFTSVHIGKNVPKTFIADLKDSIKLSKKGTKSLNGIASVYGASTKIPDRKLVSQCMQKYTDAILDMK